jgi:hypothetical protein
MAHPYHHALSSVKKWGGTVEDYLAVHSWFDVIRTIKLFCSPGRGLSWLSIGGPPPPA